MVVAAEGVAREVSELRLRQHLAGVTPIAGPVVHARADHAQRAGQELRRARATAAVPSHVMHLSVPAAPQPVFEVPLIFGQHDIGNADRIEA